VVGEVEEPHVDLSAPITRGDYTSGMLELKTSMMEEMQKIFAIISHAM
jgi:hypothetical protein